MGKKNNFIVAGIDAGNNSIKLNLNEGQTYNYENIFCERNNDKLTSQYKMNGIDQVNKYSLKDYLDVEVSFDNEVHSFLFGEQAKENKTLISERDNKYKSTDMQLVMNSIVALANTIISEKNSSEWTEKLSVDVGISVGLPFHEYQIDGAVEDYKNNFLKEFTVKFLNPSYPVKEVKLNVKKVDVDIEGYAAIRQILFEQGYYDKSVDEIRSKVASIIDIGCYSVDIVSGIFKKKIDEEGEVYPAFTTINDICDGITHGVGTAMDNVILSLTRKYAREIGQHRKITRQEILEAAKRDNILVGTKDISIEPFYTEECTKLGRNIGEKYVQLMLSGGYKDSLLKIYIAGGGALTDIVMNSLREVLKEENFNLDSIEIYKNPIFANAKGYYGIASVNLIEE